MENQGEVDLGQAEALIDKVIAQEEQKMSRGSKRSHHSKRSQHDEFDRQSNASHKSGRSHASGASSHHSYRPTARDNKLKSTVDFGTQKKFISLHTKGEATPEDEKEAYKISQEIRTNIEKTMREHTRRPQDNLPQLARNFYDPKITTHGVGTRTFVAANDAHGKNSNNGYKRGEGGAFYAH